MRSLRLERLPTDPGAALDDLVLDLKLVYGS
jgi:hypothetical protein